jgi:hypothetical protein
MILKAGPLSGTIPLMGATIPLICLLQLGCYREWPPRRPPNVPANAVGLEAWMAGDGCSVLQPLIRTMNA